MNEQAHRKTFTPDPLSRQYEFTDGDFCRLRDMIGNYSGIALSDNKRDLVYGRLTRRLRALELSRFADYCSVLETDRQEMEHFVNALTTNLTSFFREAHHFEYLSNEIIPVSYTHLTLPTKVLVCRSRWSPGR